MADEQEDLESRTELSGKRLGQAQADGNLPLGHDIPLVAGALGGLAALVALGGALRGGLVTAVQGSLSAAHETPFGLLPGLLSRPALLALAACAAAGVASAISTLVQTGGRTWGERALPDLERVLSGLTSARALGFLALFQKETLVQLGLSVAKVAALGWAAWSVVRTGFLSLPGLLGATPADQLSASFALLVKMGWRMLLVAGVLAAADLAWTRKKYFDGMKVTKPDAKRESREEEGDPLIKGKRKQKHRELARGRARVEVPRADALLVNPTHIAIALRYRKDEGGAPRVTAKGKGPLAEYMRELARENAVPIVQDVPLARLLYRKVKVGREVPAQTYKAVAAVLAFVYRMTGKAPGGRAA